MSKCHIVGNLMHWRIYFSMINVLLYGLFLKIQQMPVMPRFAECWVISNCRLITFIVIQYKTSEKLFHIS